MKRFLPLLLITGFCFLCSAKTNAQANTSGYYPLKITNNARATSNVVKTYFIMTGQQWDANATPCVLKFQWSASMNGYVGSMVPVTATTDPAKFSYGIDTMQGFTQQTKSVQLYIPHLQSGRCMLSFNYPMQMPPVASDSGYTLQEPNINNPTDANNGILFDKFEFSYDTTGTSGAFYIDATAVDFFAIPVTIILNGDTTGAPLGVSREVLIQKMQKTLQQNDKTANKIWGNLGMYSADKTTLMRLAAPYLAPSFDLSYLTNAATYKMNYVQALIHYYDSTKATVGINCSELNESGSEVFDKYGVSPQTDPGAYLFYGTMVNPTSWVFVNNPSTDTSKIRCTVNIGEANSFDFFAPGVAPFATPNKTVLSIIIRQITAAFTVGLLPAPQSMMLDSSYLNAPNTYRYYSPYNKQLPKAALRSGPWYNLYTRAVHSAIPQLYAFAFDDELGQSGTLVSTTPSDTVTVVIGSMARTTIPAYTYFPPLQPVTITNTPAFTQNSGDSTWSATVNWTVPANQPSNAEYFILPYGGSGYVTPADSLIAMQLPQTPGSLNGTYTLTLPNSAFTNGNPSGAGIQVLTCGGSYACPTSSKLFSPGGPAVQSGQTPLPASAVSWSAFQVNVNSENDTISWTTTINWTAPANQVPGTEYYWMLTSSNFLNVDSLVNMQLPGYTVSNNTSVTVTLPASWFVNNLPSSTTQLQILTCGGITSCPTATSLFPPQGAGTVPVSPTVTMISPPKAIPVPEQTPVQKKRDRKGKN